MTTEEPLSWSSGEPSAAPALPAEQVPQSLSEYNTDGAPAGSAWSFERTQALLAERDNRPNPTPKPATQPTLAFDRLQPTMLAQQLAAEDERTVRAALDAAHALLGQHQEGWRAQNEGLLDLFGALAAPADGGDGARFSAETRNTALRCIEKTLSSPAAREATLAHAGVTAALRAGIADARDAERRAVSYAALAHCGDAVASSVVAVELGFVGALAGRLAEELPALAAGAPRGAELADAVLLALRRFLAQSAQAHSVDQLLDARGDSVALLLDAVAAARAGEATQSRALGCLQFVAGEPRGKRALLAEGGAVELLLARCREAPSPAAAGAAAGALMGVLIEDDGKRAVLAAEWPALAQLVPADADAAARAHVPTLLNACTALGALAAHPQGRAALNVPTPPLAAPASARRQGAGAGASASGAERLRAVAAAHAREGGNAAVLKAASRALATVEWTPQ